MIADLLEDFSEYTFRYIIAELELQFRQHSSGDLLLPITDRCDVWNQLNR